MTSGTEEPRKAAPADGNSSSPPVSLTKYKLRLLQSARRMKEKLQQNEI